MKTQMMAIRRVLTMSSPLVLLVFALYVSVQSVAQTGATPTFAPKPLITAAIDETRLVTLKGGTLPAVKAHPSEEVAPDDLKLDRMMLQLKRSSAQDAALKQQLNDQQNPRSPQYHRWLTPEEFGEQYGATSADIATVTNWLQSHGFTIDVVAKGRNIIQFSGTQVQLRSAFHTEMRGYTIRNAHHWANASDIQIPAALSPAIAGIVSLNDVRIPGSHTDPVLLQKDTKTGKYTKVGQWETKGGSASVAGSPAPQFTTVQSGVVYNLVGPQDFATIYNVQPLWNAGLDGTGQTIAITARSNVNPADIDAFRTEFGLPAKKLNVILPTGVDPLTAAQTGDYSDEGETDLDVEWSGAVAKGATIDLVASPSSITTDGTEISEQYIVDQNLAPVLSVSYGTCEFFLLASGNQFFNEMWEQAAAQGITVVVATGDTGPSTCDVYYEGDEAYEITGLNVNGLASTPYNVAVGGTDFKTFATAPSEFWNATNDPATLASAQSYIPESPWNDSCESSELLSYVNALGASYPNNEALCQDLTQSTYQNFEGGGGGQSNCIASTNPLDESTCMGGYPKPSWQGILPGTPADDVRDVPDVSLFAANGLFYSMLAYCQSDELLVGYTCATDPQAAGGTSFAAPSFAGIMAIINQKTQSSQGVANYLLYKIAAQEFGNGSQLAACNASTAASGNVCSFYDITEGNDNIQCDEADCTSQGGGPDGVGWSAATGYDLATGIGSVNAYNLVNAWSTAASEMLPSQTTLTIPATAPYGSSISAHVSVGAAPPGTGAPTGPVQIQVDGAAFSAPSELSAGAATLPISAASVGTHQIVATYGGDATFDKSNSIASTLTVSKAPSTVALSVTGSAVIEGQSITFTAAVQVTTIGNQPTGLVTFTNNTTNTVLGTSTVNSMTNPNSGQTLTEATLTVAANVLAGGSNAITATYLGDENYAASSSNSVNEMYSTPFSMAIAPAQLQIIAATSITGTVSVSLTPAAGTTLQASDFNFECAGAIASSVSCSFSPATVNSSNGTINSTLTVRVNTSQITPSSVPADHPNGRLEAVAMSGLAGFMLTFLFSKSGRKRMNLLAVLFCVTVGFGIWGCGGSHSAPVAPPNAGPGATTTTVTPSSLTPAVGSSVTVNASVTPASAGGNGSAPTGTIAFFDGLNPLGTINLVNGSASFSSNTLSLGLHSMTAKYNGDTNDASSTSQAANVDVTYATSLTVRVTDSSGAVAAANLPVVVQ